MSENSMKPDKETATRQYENANCLSAYVVSLSPRNYYQSFQPAYFS